MSKKDVFRFAVGTPSNQQSSIWRLWLNKNDVYLGARNMLECYKVSLHNSGIWRIAFVENLERDNPTSDRLMFRWNRPTGLSGGWTPSIAILISSIEPKTPLDSKDVLDKRINWFNFPQPNKRVIFKILFSKEGHERNIKDLLQSNDHVACNFTKKNGEKVWLIASYSDLDSVDISKISDVMDKTKIHLKEKNSSEDVFAARAILISSVDNPESHTQPTILDIPLGKENLELPKF